MTDRLTDERLAFLLECARQGQQAGPNDRDAYTNDDDVVAAVLELQAARALIAKLKARGCVDDCDTYPPTCWYCHGAAAYIERDDSDDVAYDVTHTADCPYLEIERA